MTRLVAQESHMLSECHIIEVIPKIKLKMLCFDVDRQFLYTMKIMCMEDCFYRRNMHAHNITQHGVQVL